MKIQCLPISKTINIKTKPFLIKSKENADLSERLIKQEPSNSLQVVTIVADDTRQEMPNL
jgi:hypothetical protein